MDDLVAKALHAARRHFENGGDAPVIPPEFTSDTAGTPVDFRPLNFDALRQANAVRVTNRANPDGTTDTDPNAGFSIVSGWNDSMAQHGDPRSTVTWPDNPEAYGTVADMFANNPEWITPHKYRQILHSARELGMRDEDVYAQPRAHGGSVDAALHAVRHHLAGGGFLSDLFSGPDYLSTGEVASPTNWGNPDSAADFFRADKARMALAKAVADEPLTAPRLDKIEGADLPPPSEDRPLAYASEPEKNTARASQEVDGASGVWARMLRQESGNRQFDRNGRTITSPAGALGISQVMPSTGPEAARLAGLPWDLNRLRTDPEYNHALGRAYYDAQLARFGDSILAAAAYNGGPGRVASALRQAQATGRPWTNFLKPETQNYVRVVGRAHGGLVDDALHVVREHHADGNAVGQPDSNQYLADMQKFAQQNMHTLSADPERDRRALAAMMYGEMRGRPESLYAAQAAMNRSLAKGIPVADVVTAPNQFKGYSPQSLQAVTNPAGVKNSIERAAAVSAMQRATEALTGKAQGTIGPGTPFANITSFNQALPAQNYAKYGAVPGTAVVGKTMNPGDPHTYYTVKDLAGPLAKAQAKAAAAIAQAAPQQNYGPQNAQAPQAESQSNQAGNTNDVASAQPDTGAQPSAPSAPAEASIPSEAPTPSAPSSVDTSQTSISVADPTSLSPDMASALADAQAQSISDATYGALSEQNDQASATLGDISAGLDASAADNSNNSDSSDTSSSDTSSSDTGSSNDGGGQGDGNGGVGEKRGGFIHMKPHGHHIVDRAMRVVREHHADGEAVGMNRRMRDTIASIDPERTQDQPVMDPEKMGAAWQNSLRNLQNFPRQEGEAVARPLELGARDVIGGAIAGEARAPGADFRRGVADLLVGSKGLPDSGTLGFGLADAPMLTGVPLTLADMARDIGQGDYASTAMGAGLPAAFYARGPLGAAGRRAVEIAREYAKPAAATAAGVAANVVTPDEAEAAKLPKIPIPARQARPLSMEEIRSSFLPDAGRNFAPGPERERLIDAYSKLASPFSPDPELRTMGQATAKTNTPKGGFETGSGSFFKVKPTTAKEDVTSVKTPFYGPELKQENPQSWDWLTRKYEGSPLISMGGDRSDFATLYGVNQDALPYPVKVHAGFKYMLEPNPNEVWGNAAIHSGLFDAAHADLKKAMKKDLPVLGVATPMGRQSLDSSRDFTNLLLAGMEGKGIHPKDLEAFANNLRTGQFMPAKKREAGAKIMEGFPGFDSMEAARAYLLDPRIPGAVRREFAQSMDAAKWRDMGFPEVGAYRIAATDPYTMDLPANMIGGRVVEIDPSLFARAKEQKLFDHFSYPSSTYGNYVADVPFVQRHYAMPDAMERLMEKYNQERPGATKKAPKKPPLILHPFSSDTMGISSARKMFEEQKQVQELGDRVRSSLQFGEARRPTYGYRKGGSVEDHALMLVSQQA